MIVFYVEDDRDDQAIFTAAIREVQPGSSVLVADNGVDALNQLNNMPDAPGIIFLDMNMPVMNGLTCLVELKADDRFKETPVIIYSTTSNEQEIEKAVKAGANRFLIKANTYGDTVRDLKNVLETFAGQA